MTRIRATCPMCGEVDLRPSEIELEIVRDALAGVGDGSCYRFACPTCTETVTKPADERIARLLATGGVPVVQPAHQPSTLHPEDPSCGPAFTLEDLVNFHELLGTADWFHGLEAMTR